MNDNPTVNIQTTTNNYLAPMWVDGVLRDNRILSILLNKRTKAWEGATMIEPVKYKKGLATVPFSGFDTLPITNVSVSVNMSFVPKWTATNIALAMTEVSWNEAAGSKYKMLDLMEITMKSRAQDAADDIGNYLYKDGSDGGNKVFSGLGNIVDNGANASTYGNLARSTYNFLNSSVTNLGVAITLINIRRLANQIEDNSIFPDIAVTDLGTWTSIENILSQFQRNFYETPDFKAGSPNGFNGQFGLQTASGYRDIIWNGIRITKDRKCSNNGAISDTNGVFFLLNTQFLEFRSLKYSGGEKINMSTRDIWGNVYQTNGSEMPSPFTFTGWIKPINQAAINSYIIMGGQMICLAPWRQGKLTGINNQ